MVNVLQKKIQKILKIGIKNPEVGWIWVTAGGTRRNNSANQSTPERVELNLAGIENLQGFYTLQIRFYSKYRKANKNCF